MWNKIAESLDYIQSKISIEPEFGIILGTGLGNLIREVEIMHSINYGDIPHFPLSTVESHKGNMIFGYLGGRSVLVMQGRFHYYEGYSMEEVTYPVRVMQQLGIRKLIISNISGSVNTNYHKGDLVIITDHINLQTDNPLRGLSDRSFGPRFPDMSDPYSNRMNEIAYDYAMANGYTCHYGIYVSVSGPNLETKAEYRMLNLLGADIVGMSTVPEVIVGVQCGMEIFAISIVTDKNFPIAEITKITVEEVIAIATAAEPKMTAVIKHLVHQA